MAKWLGQPAARPPEAARHVLPGQQQHNNQQQHHQHLHDAAARRIARSLGSAADAQAFQLGSLVLGGLLFVAGAAPAALPALFIAFFALAMPWRLVDFWQKKYQWFCIDFCYFANTAAFLHLLLWPHDPRLEALVYALCDGPLAGALAAWQCAWVFGSAELTISVLMHLLPGLAIFAHRYYTPQHLRGWRGIASVLRQLLQRGGGAAALASLTAGPSPMPQRPDMMWLWLLGAPLAFYLVWQLFYFMVVQVLCGAFIKRRGFDTSYSCLARRAARTNNFWNRLVRRGGPLRRCAMYGAVQLAFTLITLGVFLPTYLSFKLALLLQVVKVVLPLHYGAQYQCVKIPSRQFLRGVKQLQHEQEGGLNHGHKHGHHNSASQGALSEAPPLRGSAKGSADGSVGAALHHSKRRR